MTTHKKKIVIFLILLVLAISVVLASSRTFNFQETDLVKLAVNTADPDKDKVTLNYTKPLNEKGEWQTDYGDAGEYSVKVTASDGVNVVDQDVKLVIDKKNQPPYLIKNKIVGKENEWVSLKEFVTDPENDVLEFTFNAPFDEHGKWQPSYDDEGSYVIKFLVSDGEFEINARAGLEIAHASQPPKIVDLFSSEENIEISEDKKLEYYVEAEDDEDKTLFYKWELNEEIINNEESGEHYFGFDSAGKYLLKLTVSDSIDSTVKEWNIEVENKNRKPEIDHLPVTVNEGETIKLLFFDKDIDGDLLSYEFEEPFNENGEWLTDYDDAGEHNIRITASDGELEAVTDVDITVTNVDRYPILEVPADLFVNEGENIAWEVEVYDPDDDNVNVTIKGMPEGSNLSEEAIFTWNPGFDFLKRDGGIISNVLNKLMVENHFLDEKVVLLNLEACSNGLCVSDEVNLHVYNVNQKPIISDIEDIVITESEEIKLEVEVYDPDRDFVEVRFSEPLNRKGEWETGYDNAGEYEVEIIATDGSTESNVVVLLKVLPKNREPKLKIDDDNVVVNEKQQFTVNLEALDPDEDELTVLVKNLPEGAVIGEGVFVWEPTYNTVKESSDTLWNRFVAKSNYLNKKLSRDKEVVWLDFAASDGTTEVIHPVKVVVKNINRAPHILDYSPEDEINVRVNEPVIFRAVGSDADNEILDYTWSFGLMESRVKGTDTIERTFVTPGKKKVKVVVRDRDYFVEKEWTVNVVNKKFIPPINDLDVKVYFIDQ